MPALPRTPVVELGARRWLKLDCVLPTGSFKVRGYLAAALALDPAVRAAGLATVSAGNAAAGCAWVAARLGVPCRVTMVEGAPAPKVEAVRRLGGEARFMPRPQMFEWMRVRGWESEPGAFIHPHTDQVLAAGHGVCGLELLEQVPGLRRVVVPVGGGGLVTGIAAAVRARGVEVVGVMSDGYPLWPAALAAGGDPGLAPATIADGTAAPFNPVMFERLRSAVDRWVVVPEARLRAAVAELARTVHVVAEGAGALAFAALDQLPPGEPTAALVTGGNIDRALLAELLAA